MKVICVNDQNTRWLSKRTDKSQDLTAGKSYDAMLFSDPRGQYTTTNTQFLIYNDLGEWKAYDPQRFKPST